MAEEDAIFDPTMKKKKKKKKMPLDLDAALEGDAGGGDKPEEEATDGLVQSKPIPDTEPAGQPQEENKGIDLDLEDFSNMKKKKKKKKTKPFDMDGMEDALQDTESTPASENVAPSQDTTATPEITADIDLDLDFSLTKKKKKKPKSKPRIEEISEKAEIENGKPDEMSEDEDTQNKDTSGTTWAGTERDYTYDELLNRVFDIMKAKNPDMVTGEKKRFVMRPPQVVRVGTKKSSFVNFTDICKMLHRPTEHLLAFLLAELGTSGSIDGNNQLIIKGRFQQKQIESVLRRYIKEYVTCHTCRSSETFLHKENRLFFLQCERCQSRCSVASIKSGFQALTGKRAQMRAKAN